MSPPTGCGVFCHWWLGAFLIPASAGVESQHLMNTLQPQRYEARTRHHTPAMLGCGNKVSKESIVATLAQKEQCKLLVLRFFEFLLTPHSTTIETCRHGLWAPPMHPHTPPQSPVTR
jgi:hypothetical protein